MLRHLGLIHGVLQITECMIGFLKVMLATLLEGEVRDETPRAHFSVTWLPNHRVHKQLLLQARKRDLQI